MASKKQAPFSPSRREGAGGRAFIKILALLAMTEVGIAACSDSGPAPSLTSISPDAHPVGVAPATRIVVVSGAGFWQRLVPDAANANASTIDNPRVEIGGSAATLSAFTSTALTVVVPEVLVATGEYAVRVENPDGASAELAGPGYRIVGPQILISSSTEAGLGTSNEVTLTGALFDAEGAPLQAGAEIIATVTVTSNATITSGPFTIAAGSTAGTIVIRDSKVETVQVGLSGLLVDHVPGSATFIPGPAALVRVEAATGAAGSTSLTTTVRVIDVDRNPVLVHPALNGTSFATGACSGNYQVTPDPVPIPANTGATTITVTCNLAPSSVRIGLSGLGALVSTSGLLIWQ